MLRDGDLQWDEVPLQWEKLMSQKLGNRLSHLRR